MPGWFRKGFLFGVVLVIGFTSRVNAQLPVFTSTHYTSENTGLSHNTVLHIMQDQAGFIWFSTMDGLNRFDGKTMRVFRHNSADSTSLSNSFIHGVTEDKDGLFWIGTRDGGVNLMDPRTGKITRIQHQPGVAGSIPDGPVNRIFRDSEDLMWLSFFSGELGIYQLGNERFLKMDLRVPITNEGLSSVNSILELKDGSFLISSFKGVYYLEAESVRRFRNNPQSGEIYFVDRILFSEKEPHPNINTMYIDSKGTFWVELVGRGIQELKTEHLSDSIKESVRSGIKATASPYAVVEREPYIMMGGEDGEILVIDKQTKAFHYIPITKEETKGAAKIFEDREGRIWFYTWGKGVHLLHERKGIKHITTKEGLPSDFILGFAEEGEDSWVATNNGLGLIRANGTVENYHGRIQGFSDDSIWSLYRDDLGLWIATRHDGLFFVPAKELQKTNPKARRFHIGNSVLASNNVHQVMRDSRGWLWLGYQGEGVQIIHNVENWLNGSLANSLTLTNEGSEIKLNSRSVRKIYEDQQANIWIATTGNGFNYLQFSGNRISEISYFEPGNQERPLSHRDGRSIYQQNDSTFWLATYGGGINRWNRYTNQLVSFQINQGLANNSSYGILPDKDPKVIWISTNNGLSRLNTETLRFINFTLADGLQNNEFNTGAYFVKENGELLFGGVNGVNIIKSEEFAINQTPPPVYLTQIRLFNEPLVTDTTAGFIHAVNLDYNQNFLSFDFAALDYSEPLSVQYAYKMEGIDEDWVYSGNRTTADYPGMRPGTYSFNVKAANGDGVWNPKVASLSIVIRPPWWNTWWFQTLAISLVLILLANMIRYYSQRRLKKQIRKMEIENRIKDERERISRDLHDHVGAQLANILSGLSLVDKYTQSNQRKKANTLMKALKTDATVTIRQLRETIWALNQNSMKLDVFVEHLQNYFKTQRALTSTLELSISIEGGQNPELSSPQALNLFRIIQEAAQNTLKYANADQFHICFQQRGDLLHTTIKDNGTFNGDNAGFNGGYGLKNMKKRVQEINGNIKIQIEQGMEIQLSFYLDK